MPKPRTRQRIVFCDCVDCIDRPQTEYSTEQLSIADAIARQLPPPKAIILFGSGLLDEWEGHTNLDASQFPHLDRIVKDGSLGMLALEAYTGKAIPSIHEADNCMVNSAWAPCLRRFNLRPFPQHGRASTTSGGVPGCKRAWLAL